MEIGKTFCGRTDGRTDTHEFQSTRSSVGDDLKKLECGPMPNEMAAQPNIGGTLCENSVIPFLLSCHKVWLRPAAGVPCSKAANIREHKTWTQSEFYTCQNSVRVQKPPKYIHSVPAKKMTKDRAKFGWPPLSDVAAVTKPRHEIG